MTEQQQKNLSMFITTFDLVEIPDPMYDKMKPVAAMFEKGIRYTTQMIFDMLAKKYRKSLWSNQEWYPKANKAMDLLLYYDFLEYREGYYYRY